MKTQKNRSLVFAIILSVFVFAISGCGNRQTPLVSTASVSAVSSTPPQSPTPSAAASGSSSDVPDKIDPRKFDTDVQAYISNYNVKNAADGILSAKTSVSILIGFADITMSDTTFWSSLSDSGKKEWITTLGKDLDAIATKDAYPGTIPQVGSDTTIYAKNGQKLAERTSLGIVKLS